jgi:hypothetical protein
MSNGDDQGIQLGNSSGGGPGMSPMDMMGGGGDSSPPSLAMSSDNPDMGEAPEQGSATIHFHKHSHTKERHPSKPGHHRHHVHLKVHSIKFHPGKKKSKVSQEELEEALSGGGPPGDESGEGEAPPPQ